MLSKIDWSLKGKKIKTSSLQKCIKPDYMIEPSEECTSMIGKIDILNKHLEKKIEKQKQMLMKASSCLFDDDDSFEDFSKLPPNKMVS